MMNYSEIVLKKKQYNDFLLILFESKNYYKKEAKEYIKHTF